MRTSEPSEGRFEELEGRKEAAVEGGLSIIFIQCAQLSRKFTGRLHRQGTQAPSGPCFQSAPGDACRLSVRWVVRVMVNDCAL